MNRTDNARKLTLSRTTLRLLTPATEAELRNVRGGDASASREDCDNGRQRSPE
jgi:hypothetical protein